MTSTVRDRERGKRSGDQGGEEGQSSSERGEKRRGQQVKSSHIITEHIDVGVPGDVAFEQWTHYDRWSQVFKNESADRGDKRRKDIKVSAKIGPSSRQWTAEVVQSEPEHRLRWRSKGPLKAKGTTTFHRLDDRLTRLMVEIEYQPTGLLETVGNFFRMQRRRVRRDLRLFKHYIELRGRADGQDEEDT